MEEVIISLNQHSIMEPKVYNKYIYNYYQSIIFFLCFDFDDLGNWLHCLHTAEEQHGFNWKAVFQEKQVAGELAVHKQSTSEPQVSIGAGWLFTGANHI